MLKKINLFFCIIILIISAHGCGEEATPTAEPNLPDYEGIILAIGDSLTEGLGVEQGYAYNVINAGVSGETSSGARSRLKWALTLKPDIVIHR
jgi:acyl-CoA thioesterase-1